MRWLVTYLEAMHRKGKLSLQNKSNWQCSQFRTVPASTADIFLTGAWNGIETTLFRTGLNIGSTRSVPAIPAEILDFDRKMDTGPKQKRRFLCNFSLT